MVREAHAAGLVFDVPLLGHYVNSGSDPIRHDPLNLMYRVDNALLRTKAAVRGRKDDPFVHGRRRMTTRRALSVRVASSAVTHYQEGGYAPPNLVEYAKHTHAFDGVVEPVVSLPEAGVDLGPYGVPAGKSPASR
jgi:hypothetical protein